MRRFLPSFVLILMLLASARGEVVFLGATSIPGTAEDKSGLKATLPDGTPHNRLGGIGSAIAWTGRDNRYVLLPDRGPKDGATPYACRFHVFDVEVPPNRQPPLKATLVATHLLTDEAGRQLVGSAAAFDTGLRFDPEAVRLSKIGNLFIADEYGPAVGEFSPRGKRLRSLKVPDHYRIAVPAATPDREEPPHNARGRAPNRGFEGLALSLDGARLYALLQSPLLQDGSRTGVNARLLEIDVETGKTREMVYPLESPSHGASEVLAVNAHVFLTIESDDKGAFRKVFRVNLAGATDVSGTTALPLAGVPEGVTPAVKDAFIDLLDPRFGVAAGAKVEGMAFGPDLPDGRKLLLVTTDNDFDAKVPTRLYAFAVDPADLTAPWPGPMSVLPVRPPDESVSPFMLPLMLAGVIAGCLLVLLIAWRWVGGGRNRLVSQRK